MNKTRGQTMVVVFRRVGERRYAVEVKREVFPDLEMNPAPGYDAFIPHDLMHMVVEAELGFTGGVFGQLAAGGDAGTFHPVFKQNETSREMARVRRSLKARGKKLLKEGRDESAQSERATFVCWHEWKTRRQSSKRKTAALSRAEQAKAGAQHTNEGRRAATAQESGALNQRKLGEICEQLDKLSSCWSSLEVGQGIAVRWPDLDLSTDVSGL